MYILTVALSSSNKEEIFASLIFIFEQSILDLTVSLVFLFMSTFHKPDDVMDSGGWVGFLECMFWQSKFFFWTFSVSSTYNIVTMTVERYDLFLCFLDVKNSRI